RVTPGAGADHDGELGACDPLGSLLDALGGRGCRQRAQRALTHWRRTCFSQVAQYFARHAQVNGAFGFAHRDVQRTADDFFRRLARAQFVVPLDPLAHAAALVEAVLAPVDTAVARVDVVALG